MEPKKLTISELRRMEEGEIPMTDEGREQIQRFKNVTSSIHENLGSLIAKASTVLPAHINHQLFQNHSLVSGQILNPILAQIATSHESMQNIASVLFGKSLEIQNQLHKAFLPFNSNLNHIVITDLFKKITNDPNLNRRFSLLSEKETLIHSVINKWKKNLEYRMNHMPFEPFEYQFEHACYDLLDNARNNEELSEITQDDIAEILHEVAARITAIHEIDAANRVRRHKNLLTQQGKKPTILEIDQEKPQLFIPSSVQTTLLKLFSKIISEAHVETLELLFENSFSDQRIWIKVSAGRLATIFKQVKESDDYMRGVHMTKLSIWVEAHFSWGSKKPKPISRHTVYNALKSKKPKRNQY